MRVKVQFLIIKVNSCAPKWIDTGKNEHIKEKTNKCIQKRINTDENE
jgi:hypothetical protein